MNVAVNVEMVSKFAEIRNLERCFEKAKAELLRSLSVVKGQVEAQGCVFVDIHSHIVRYEEIRRLYNDAIIDWRRIHYKRRKKAEDIVLFAEKAANEAFSAINTTGKTNLIWKMDGRPFAKTTYSEVMDGKLKMFKEHWIMLTPREAINLYLKPQTSPGRYYIGLDEQGYYYYVVITRGGELSLIYEGELVKQEVISIAEKLI